MRQLAISPAVAEIERHAYLSGSMVTLGRRRSRAGDWEARTEVITEGNKSARRKLQQAWSRAVKLFAPILRGSFIRTKCAIEAQALKFAV